jgi:uncharacterized protein (TIGR03118 family)
MPSTLRSTRSLAVLGVTGALVISVPAAASAGSHRNDRHAFAVQQVNLVSDVPGQAPLVDPDLVNPWGLALGPTTPIWSANAGTDTSTLYTSAPGATTASKVSAVRVTLPGSPAIATGQVFNGGSGFVNATAKGSGPARFIFSTITGRIEAWSPVADPLLGAVEVRNTVPGAAYTGLAIATAKNGEQLYAANFAQGRVDVFDSNFNLVKSPATAFHDDEVPTGFAPFGVQTLNGNVFVTYAKVDPVTHHDIHGAGLGFVDEYTPDGSFVDRIASRGPLNTPWGLALAPASWGKLAGSLLIGNFGDGRINVVGVKANGHFDHDADSQLRNTAGDAVSIPGLWALVPGTAATGGTNSVWFSAGIGNEKHGLLGVLRP